MQHATPEVFFLFFFFNDTATTEIYTLSLHDALPISRAARAVAVLTLVGALNLPIIKFSVDWWSTLHQPSSVLRLGGPAMHPSILVPLLVMGLAFFLLFFTLHLAAMRNEIMRRRVRTLMLMQADAAAGH